MFKNATAHLIDKYLGDYIENLDTKKLKVDLWNGNVVLENLYLKSDALANLNLPFTIITGCLRKLSLHVSWKHLHTHPIKITIDGFYLLVRPNTEVKYDAEREEEEQYDIKMKEVYKVEEFHKGKEEYESSKKSSKHEETFLDHFQLNLIRNLEVSITNIHIAVEDKITKPAHPFSFGITLNYIKLHTVNTEWGDVTSKENLPIVHKLGELNNLSMYWNSNVKPRTDLSKENLVKDLHAKILVSNRTSFENISYVLEPLNIKVKLKIATMPSQQDYVRPVIDAKIDIDQINLNIDRDQYWDLLDLLEFQDYIKLKSKYIKYYAMIEINKPSLRRWKFAFAVILNEQVRPRLAYYKWANIRAHLNRRREYQTLHFKELTGKASKQEKQRAQELEKQIDPFNLILVRRIAIIEVKKKNEVPKKKSWGKTLLTKLRNKSDSDTPGFDLESVTTTEEKKKLYDAIGYKDDPKSASYPEEYVDIDLSIQLNLIELNVYSSIEENDSQPTGIARAVVSNTGLAFRRRPATSAILLIFDINSVGIYGASVNPSEEQILRDNRPVLIELSNRLQLQPQKLLHIEFETNPLKTNADYRIQAKSQSIEITYHAVTINNLIACFHPGSQRDLKGIKKTAYSIYTDIKHRTQFLLSYNFRNIKGLDIDIDLQSSYFLLPKNGDNRTDSSAICLDFGHFTIQGGQNHIDQKDDKSSEDAQEIHDTGKLTYIPLKVRLEDMRLIYAKPNEDWKQARNERDSSAYLIKPITLALDIFKSIYVDDPRLPLWKIDARVSAVETQFSDTRLLEVIQLIRSIPLPESQESSPETQTIEELFTSEGTIPQTNTKTTYQTIENMTPVKKSLKAAENNEDRESNKQKVNTEVQFTELEATLNIPRIDLCIEESLSAESDHTQSFARISFVSISARTSIKTFDIEFDASLTNLIILHEQFLTKNNQPLRLLSTKHDEKLFSVKSLFTSTENPLFNSDSYNRIEDQVRVHISPFIMMLQVEALISILRFQKDLMEKLPKQQSQTESNSSNEAQEKPSTSLSTSQIEIDLEEFRAVLGTQFSQILDIRLQGLIINASRSPGKSSANLVLNDFRVFDKLPNARYPKIVSHEVHEKQIFRVDFARFNHSKIHEKTLDEVDYHVKIYLTKMNIVLLYKHVDFILDVLDELEMAITGVSSNTSLVYDMIQQFEEQTFKIRFDISINAPNLLIPINSHSNEATFVDSGQLILKTHFLDDPSRSIVEQHTLIFKNLSASRVHLNNNNEILDDVNLLDCDELCTRVDRLLHTEKLLNEARMSVKVEWETMDLAISKDDYSCLMKIYNENFSEKFYYKIPQPIDQEQLQDEQRIQENTLNDVTVQQKKHSSHETISEKIRLDFQMKKISLTLYAGESNLTIHRSSSNQNFKLINMRIEMLEGHFQQFSDESYNAKAQIQYFLMDDLRITNPPNSITRLLDRNFNVDHNAQMFNITVTFNPKSETNPNAVRQVDAQSESLYLCLAPNYLMALRDFFISIQSSSDNETKSQLLINSPQSSSAVTDDLTPPAQPISTHRYLNQQSISSQSPPAQVSSISKNEIETRIDVLIKTPEIIWIENQEDANSNCLVLSCSFQMQMITVAEKTNFHGSANGLTMYGANFNELKHSKMKYHILKPINTNVVFIMNSDHQKIDINIGDISLDVDPPVIHTIVRMANSISELQTTIPDEKEITNCKSLFDPKPFKNASFWFIKERETNQEMLEQTDASEITTSTLSTKKTEKLHSQQVTINLKLMEVKLELGSGSRRKSVIAICLSNLFTDVHNWSSDKMSIYSRVQVEIALFNDRILAWEPLIEPIINERGEIISPWSITCSTMTEDDENDNQSPCISHHQESLLDTEEQRNESSISFNAKNKIHIRSEHILNVTLTKTSMDLAQHLSAVFSEVNKKHLSTKDDNDQEPILSVHNMTGYDILIDNITGVAFADNNQSESSVHLKRKESIVLTVSDEQLSATHLPTIAKSIGKRQQEFSVKIDQDVIKVDISRTWKRVYQLGPSSIPDGPIQMLCDSHIYNDRRRVILSSIVKLYNRTIMPLLILDFDSTEMRKSSRVGRVEVSEEYYLPIDILYKRSSPRLFIAIDEGDSTEHINNLFSFDWRTELTTDRRIKLKNGKEAQLVIYVESIDAYADNTDEPTRTCFHIHIKLALHLINLLPIDVQCSIDSDDPIDLNPSELYPIISGHKNSVLKFTIPSYNNVKWISEPIDLKMKGHGIHNEYIVQFHDVKTQYTLRMVLRLDTYRKSYRASLYSPFWSVNCTDLKFELKIESEKTFIDVVDAPFFICPKKFDSEAQKKKAQIRLYSIEQDDTVSQWSEAFSLDVIKSTGITSCKVSNDRNYMVCVSIVTSSFGMTKIITFSSSMTIINNSTIEVEVVETVSGIQQGNWKLIKPDEIIPFWPRDIKEGVMCVRYVHNRSASSTFVMNDKHRTLLRINDEERPALHVEVTATDSDGFRVVFSDYKIGDAPLLLLNCLRNQPLTYCQQEDTRAQFLPPQYYAYYTWIEPFKPHELVIASNGRNLTIQINPLYGVIKSDDGNHVYYTVFYDGPQMVLIFSDDKSLIESVSDITSLTESMSQYIQISLREIGISVVNDITRDDLLYITINKSKEIWTETQKSVVKPLSCELNHCLEKHYQTNIKNRKANPNDKIAEQKQYYIDKNCHVSFNEDIGEVMDDKGHRTRVKRQTLDGLWIGYVWSVSNAAFHVRINHVQIDNQLQYTMFPVILYPIVSKAAGTNIPGKPFIELIAFKTTVAQSTRIHFKYFKLLIQEFAICADQGLIVSVLAFIRSETDSAAPTIHMNTDLKRIDKPLETIIKAQIKDEPKETEIYFDSIHLSPLKIHFSFSMHGARPSDQMLTEYPLADFLLQLLNVAEVQDVILKLNFYERKKDRFKITRLTNEIQTHYEQQLFKQIHVVVLGLDVLGNPYGLIRGVAEGVQSFFYEPYKGAMEGPLQFIQGFASGTEHLLGSAVGGAAGAVSKITDVISKSLAKLTFDEDYQNARTQRKELTKKTTYGVVHSGKNVVNDVVHGVKGVVKKPLAGGKEGGASGFVKGLGKGFMGLVARPTSGAADFTSTSFNLIKRIGTDEEVAHRVRHPRHVGRDGIIRPSIAYETTGFYIFNRLDSDKYTKSNEYIAHISCSENEPGWLLATIKYLIFATKKDASSDFYEVEWYFTYKDLKGAPVVKFDPDQIEILLRESIMLGRTKKELANKKIIVCQTIGEARYIVDKITQTMHAFEL